MTIAISPVYRQFTKEQSSAINSITVDGTDVVVIWHNNVDKAYAFTCSENYAQFLSDLLTNDAMLEKVSIGSTIADARKTGELQQVTVWYDSGGFTSPHQTNITDCKCLESFSFFLL